MEDAVSLTRAGGRKPHLMGNEGLTTFSACYIWGYRANFSVRERNRACEASVLCPPFRRALLDVQDHFLRARGLMIGGQLTHAEKVSRLHSQLIDAFF